MAKKLSTYLKSIGMKQTYTDQCLYVKREEEKIVIILVYVDDLLVASNCLNSLNQTKRKLLDQFEMKDLGEVSSILGIEVKRDTNKGQIEICQREYIQKILEKYEMTNANPVATPMDTNQKLLQNTNPISEKEKQEMERKPYRELIGGLTYLSNTVRPDIAFAVNLLSRFCEEPRIIHWNAAKRILRYLKGTIEYKITYQKKSRNPICYVDSDWAGDVQDRRSCSGYAIIMGGGPIFWKSKKQRSVAMSTMEAEYMALSEAVKETMHLRKLLSELTFQKYCQKETIVYCDNQSAIKLSKNNTHHNRSKHVDTRYHFCREKQDEGHIKVEYMPTASMLADILTKGLVKIKHENCVKMLGLLN